MKRRTRFAFVATIGLLLLLSACTLRGGSTQSTATPVAQADHHSLPQPAPPSGGAGMTPVSSTHLVYPAYAMGAPWTSQPSWTQPAGAPTPVAGQPCPVWVHDRYAAQGPDGLWYPTWHAETDPQYGCHFGHEHGDDPTGSPALADRPVLFGYASIHAGMHEPHVGFKVFRWDDVQSSNGPSHDGASVVMVIHQGTSGTGRFTIPEHSVQFDYVNPTDGRELHVMMMAPFGTLLAGCGANDPQMALKIEQEQAPGARQVATDRCFDAPNIPYEDWITAMYVGVDSQGEWKAYLDPHFAIFNPNTYCIVKDGACELGQSAERASAPPTDYKGTKREAYLNQVWLDNPGGPTTIWTDPFGKVAAPDAQGAIPQYIAAMDVQPHVDSTAFGKDHNPDADGSVQPPN